MRIGELADRTPAGRDRLVDAVRAFAIAVVVLWHWVGSLTHRAVDGVVVMPNPIDDVPGGWVATWVLQVVPLFFVVGGYANLAGWDSTGGRAAEFLRRRARRLLAPVAVWVALWLAVEVVAESLVAGHRPLWDWFPGVLVPLWFLLVYAATTALVPLTARWHRAAGVRAVLVLTAVLVVVELLGRFGGVPGAVWVATILVWVLVHQLGYLWRDRGMSAGASGASGGSSGGMSAGASGASGGVSGGADPWTGVVVAAAGLGALVVLTGVAGYPRSMVATEAVDSNLLPTTPAVLALAVFQLGLVWTIAGPARRVLAARWAWRPVVALNAVALTVFVWHMTAYAVVFLAAEQVGVVAGSRPTAEWLASRPLWLAASAAVLFVLVVVFGRVETGARAGTPATPVKG